MPFGAVLQTAGEHSCVTGRFRLHAQRAQRLGPRIALPRVGMNLRRLSRYGGQPEELRRFFSHGEYGSNRSPMQDIGYMQYYDAWI